MPAVTPIPVKIDPEAAAYIAELQLETEFERMLEYVRQSVAGICRIDVELALPYDTGIETGILIQAFRDPAFRRENDPAWEQLSDWTLKTFPPDVYQYFTCLILDASPHAS